MKKIIKIAFVTALSVIISAPVYALNTDDDGYIHIEDGVTNMNLYTESGETITENAERRAEITYVITQKDAAENSKPILVGQTKLGALGEIDIKVPIKAPSGEYNLRLFNFYLGTKDYEFSHTNNFYRNLNSYISSNDIDGLLLYQSENANLIGLDSAGYSLVDDAVKTQIAQSVFDRGKLFESNEEAFEFYQAVNISKIVFGSSSADKIAEYILTNYENKTNGYDSPILAEFEKLSVTSRCNAAAVLIGADSFGYDEKDVFYHSVLKEKTSQYVLASQMEEILLQKDNIWGFNEEQLKKLSACDTNGVYAEMMDNISKEKTLSKYTSLLENAIKNNPKKNSSGGSGGSSGGKGSSSGNKGSISLPANTGSYVKPDDTSAEKEFSDVPKEYWAYDIIQKLYEKNVIVGRTDELFMPDELVKREEFVKMIISAMKLTGQDANANFDDVSRDEWYYEYISAAQRAGIVSGSGNLFGIGNNITREDSAVILYRALEFKNISLIRKEDKTFEDGTSISDYAKEAVQMLADSNLVNGYADNTFVPKGSLKRAEAAKLIYEFMKQINEL